MIKKRFKKFYRNAYRGSRPEDLALLKIIGIEVIGDFQSGTYELLTETKRERQHPVDYGIDYYDLGSSNIFPLEDHVVDKALELIRSGRICFFHCMSGVDRTGEFVAIVRVIEEGWTIEEAIREWKDEGRHFWFFWWERSFKKQIKRLQKN